MESLRAVKGMNDLFENELVTWRFIEDKARKICLRYGYEEIRTPILEETALFVRGVGEGTDIVEKEIYTLEDRDGKSLALRPENTASVVRAMVENNRFSGQETENRVYYLGPMFRRERPQKGRYRQFSQFGVEVFGSPHPSVDTETMALLYDFMTDLGLSNLSLLVNTLGEPEERFNYVEQLKAYLNRSVAHLCTDCTRRLQTNPLRILDCKVPQCAEVVRSAPVIADYLSPASLEHFESVCEGLEALGIPYVKSPRLVRGLDYYTRTVFELVAETGLGAQNAVGAGGRYDKLVENLGGPSVPAFGFAAGIERIVLLLQEAQKALLPEGPELVLVAADEKGRSFLSVLVRELRQRGIFADRDHHQRSLKAQMRRADRLQAKAVLVLGEREIDSGQGQIKFLADKKVLSTSLLPADIAQALRQP